MPALPYSCPKTRDFTKDNYMTHVDGACECGCGGRTTVSPRDNKATGAIKGQPQRFLHGHNRRNPPRTCEQCGRSFSGESRTRFCSRACVHRWNNSRPKHATPIQCRRLTTAEAIPTSEPHRYKQRAGYIILRWKVGVRSYVEALEHRVVAGFVGDHVHHENGRKDDNRPDNLVPLSAREHSAAHSRVNMAEAVRLYREGWSLPRLAARYGVGNVTVMRSLKLRGVTMRTLSEAWKFRKAVQA